MNFSFLDKEKLNTGFGNDISMVKTLDEALEVGGLNWSAEPRKLLYVGADGTSIPIPNMVANVKTEDLLVLFPKNTVFARMLKHLTSLKTSL